MNTLYPKHELTSYGRLGSDLMFSNMRTLDLAFNESNCQALGVHEG